MSLITRCPACGTMFKVVSDQLKVSQGWVRCGQCADVFDASLHLQSPELVPDAPSTSQYSPPVDSRPGPELVSSLSAGRAPAAFQAKHSFSEPSTAPSPLDDFGPESSGFDPVGWKQKFNSPALDEAGHLRLSPQGEAVRGMPLNATPESYREMVIQDVVEPLDPPVSVPSADSENEVETEAPHDVSFVRDARRQAFWRRTPVRLMLGTLSFLLLIALGMQLAIQQRDSLAAQHPELKPALVALCGYLKCELGPLRRIESIAIDSSSFNRIGPDAYRLSFSLKNSGVIALAMPSLEVTLTDNQDQALLRRVLKPSDFGAGNAGLNVGSDFAGMVAIKVSPEAGIGASANTAGSLRVAGYRMLAFYP